MPVDPVALDHFLSWDGEVGQSFLRRIESFEDIVRANAPLDTGELIRDIGHELSSGVGHDLVALVGDNPDQHVAGYAAIVHDGSKPHEILPIPPGKSLKFKMGGRVVYARRVFHPGTDPDPFLMQWAEEITR